MPSHAAVGREEGFPEEKAGQYAETAFPVCRNAHGVIQVVLASQRLQPEKPGLLGEYVGSNQGIGGHVRHYRVHKLPALTERQRIADPGEGPCQLAAVQHGKEDGRHEAHKPRKPSPGKTLAKSGTTCLWIT
jgi:hypothetical protein